VIYGILFKAAADTLLAVAADPEHLGARIGITAVLHTWGSALTRRRFIVTISREQCGDGCVRPETPVGGLQSRLSPRSSAGGQSFGAGLKSSSRSVARASARRLRSLAAGPSSSMPIGSSDTIPAGRTTLGSPAELLGAMLRANATRAGTNVPFISTSNPGDVRFFGNGGAGIRTTGKTTASTPCSRK
jgi:hypothetical protein